MVYVTDRVIYIYIYIYTRKWYIYTVADRGGCNRYVFNGQIFLIKNANLCYYWVIYALSNVRNPHRTIWFSNLWFKIIRLSKLRRTISVTLSYSILSRADIALTFKIQNNSITWSILTTYIPLLRTIGQGTISPLLSSLKVEDLSNMLNFAPLPLRSDAVQILFLVKYATVKGCRPVKRVQYDDVCDGQLISDSPPLKKSSKPLLIPELENVEYNT